MESKEPNKTIVITYDDATRMMDYCNDSKGDISKEFFDWYLGEETFFSTSGMLIVDGIATTENKRTTISFNFANPDIVEFNYYNYADQSIICNFLYYRQKNLNMDVAIDIKKLVVKPFKETNIYWLTHQMRENMREIARENVRENIARPGFRQKKASTLEWDALNEFIKKVTITNCEMLVLMVYSMMYYMSKQESEEITTDFRAEMSEQEKVKSIYKYTGYVDLRENKTYRPIIRKDPNDPVREYNRHIQRWTVRGHYRNTKKGRVWIGQHSKGEGELVEERIYATVDEKELKLRPQVFQVMRKKPGAHKRKNRILQQIQSLLLYLLKLKFWGKT